MSAEVFEQMVEAVEGLIRRSIAPLADDIKAIEKSIPVVRDGKDGAAGIAGERGERGEKGIDGAPGQKGDRGDKGDKGDRGEKGDAGEKGDTGTRGEKGDKGIDGLPGRDGDRGEKGLDGAPGRDGDRGIPGERGEKGADGTSVTVDQVLPLIEAPVSKWMLECERRANDTLNQAIGRIPVPKDGANGRDGIDGKNGIDGAAGIAGEKGAPGRDGVGIDRLVVDQKSVEFILTDGTSAVVEMPVGPQGEKGIDGAPGINGRDGAPGIDGKDGAPGLRGEKGDTPSMADIEAVVMKFLPDMLHKALDAALQRSIPDVVSKAAALVPPGRDGLPGAPGRPGATGEDGIDGKDGSNGRDGFGIEDFDVTLKEDGRTLVVKLANETQEVTKEIRLDIPVYQGVYKSGEYQRGDSVTYGGSLWIAKRQTKETPPSADWQLAVKKGADAK
jgi:hypothetical protein